jgi:hypothetical protein
MAVSSMLDDCDPTSTADRAAAMAAGAMNHKRFHSYTTTA